MIQLNDKTIKYFKNLTKKEMMLYLVIMRYITENEDVPVDHIKLILQLPDLEFSREIQSLQEKGLLRIRKLEINCPIEEKSGKLTVRNKKLQEGRKHYIYNNINLYKNELSNKSISLSDRAEKEFDVTRQFRKGLSSLKERQLNTDTLNLVNYFADRLFKMYGINRTPEWRRQQLAVAKRILGSYKLSIIDWKQAIEFFMKQDYWGDKLKSLKQIENNIQQFLVKSKKIKKTATKVKTIK
tara:strand:- start:463 stop:1182 length:720 start_codon:yes stop_codon:yes gene_type:complete